MIGLIRVAAGSVDITARYLPQQLNDRYREIVAAYANAWFCPRAACSPTVAVAKQPYVQF